MLFTFLLYLQDSSVSVQKAAFGQLEEFLNVSNLDKSWFCSGIMV